MNTKEQGNIPPIPPNNSKSSTMIGAVIVLFGAFLLLRNLKIGFFLPSWLIGWQMILIIIGVVIGINSNFKKKSSVILITLGGLFLLKEWMDFSIGKILIPVIAIGIGFYIMNRNRKANTPSDLPEYPTVDESYTPDLDWDKRVPNLSSTIEINEEASDSSSGQSKQGSRTAYQSNYYSENYLKVDAIFGSLKKIVLTKNFLGGNMTNVFGSTEINLLQADIHQPVVIDIFQLFGSTKIIVPPHWIISAQVSSILSENDDRRVIISHPSDHNKRLYITGTSILGNIAIKNS